MNVGEERKRDKEINCVFFVSGVLPEPTTAPTVGTTSTGEEIERSPGTGTSVASSRAPGTGPSVSTSGDVGTGPSIATRREPGTGTGTGIGTGTGTGTTQEPSTTGRPGKVVCDGSVYLHVVVIIVISYRLLFVGFE